MPPWLQTILMLREDQVIRWGRINFWISMFATLLFAMGTWTAYYMVNFRLTKAVTWQADTLLHDAKILSLDSSKEKPLLLSCRMVARTLGSTMEALGSAWVLIAALIPFTLLTGVFSIRLRELALELQRLKKEHKKFAPDVSHEEQHSP